MSRKPGDFSVTLPERLWGKASKQILFLGFIEEFEDAKRILGFDYEELIALPSLMDLMQMGIKRFEARINSAELDATTKDIIILKWNRYCALIATEKLKEIDTAFSEAKKIQGQAEVLVIPLKTSADLPRTAPEQVVVAPQLKLATSEASSQSQQSATTKLPQITDKKREALIAKIANPTIKRSLVFALTQKNTKPLTELFLEYKAKKTGERKPWGINEDNAAELLLWLYDHSTENIDDLRELLNIQSVAYLSSVGPLNPITATPLFVAMYVQLELNDFHLDTLSEAKNEVGKLLFASLKKTAGESTELEERVRQIEAIDQNKKDLGLHRVNVSDLKQKFAGQAETEVSANDWRYEEIRKLAFRNPHGVNKIDTIAENLLTNLHAKTNVRACCSRLTKVEKFVEGQGLRDGNMTCSISWLNHFIGDLTREREDDGSVADQEIVIQHLHQTLKKNASTAAIYIDAHFSKGELPKRSQYDQHQDLSTLEKCAAAILAYKDDEFEESRDDIFRGANIDESATQAQIYSAIKDSITTLRHELGIVVKPAGNVSSLRGIHSVVAAGAQHVHS